MNSRLFNCYLFDELMRKVFLNFHRIYFTLEFNSYFLLSSANKSSTSFVLQVISVPMTFASLAYFNADFLSFILLYSLAKSKFPSQDIIKQKYFTFPFILLFFHTFISSHHSIIHPTSSIHQGSHII